MDDKTVNEASGFVCFLGVVFLIMGFFIVLVLPVILPFFQESGAHLHGWWLVAFGAIGITISCWGGFRKTRLRPGGHEAGSAAAHGDGTAIDGST